MISSSSSTSTSLSLVCRHFVTLFALFYISLLLLPYLKNKKTKLGLIASSTIAFVTLPAHYNSFPQISSSVRTTSIVTHYFDFSFCLLLLMLLKFGRTAFEMVHVDDYEILHRQLTMLPPDIQQRIAADEQTSLAAAYAL